MSGHEHERLSAYLDDELDAVERARVAAHLGACADCTARLAELAAVDEAAASLPAEPPQGYFEALPARVRVRLEPRTRARRLPVWTWAAAAALLLAVVTPLTLLRRPDAGSSPPAQEVPVAAPALATAQAPEPHAPEKARTEPKAEARPRRPVPAPATPLAKKRESGFAAAPTEADTLAPEASTAPAATTPMVPAAPPPAASEAEVAALADAPAMAEAATGRRNQAQSKGGRAPAETARDASAEAARDEALPARGRMAGSAAAAGAAPKLVVAEADWRRLDATRPRTPAEWRRLRDEWRRFVEKDPDGPQADAARVRTIEAGFSAWHSAGDAADGAVFRQDAAMYLERDDAAQKERVRRLLADAGPP